jgi:AcrR family transcriptional regulator
MARRGEDLRAHILWTAKQVFLEQGFERASMDEIAARAQTSKRSLYAHFGSKENVYIEVVDLVRDLYLARLGMPGDYAEDPAEALTRFLARVSGQVRWEQVVRTCRLAIAEAERLPDAARGYYTVIMGAPVQRISEFLVRRFGWDAAPADAAADDLLTRTLYPALMRALFAAEAPLAEMPDGDGMPDGVELAPIRAVVSAVLAGTPLPVSGSAPGV